MLTRTTFITSATLLLILFFSGLFYYYYSKVTILPDWYTETDAWIDSTIDVIPARSHSFADQSPSNAMQATDPVDQSNRQVDESQTEPAPQIIIVPELAPNTKTVISPPNEKSSKKKRISSKRRPAAKRYFELTAEQIPDLVYKQIDQASNGNANNILKAVRSKISHRVVEIEMVVDVIELQSMQYLSEPELSILAQLIKSAELKELYLRLELIPDYRNDIISLKPESTVSIGDIHFNLREMESQLGLSLDQFQLAVPGYKKLKLQRGKIILN